MKRVGYLHFLFLFPSDMMVPQDGPTYRTREVSGASYSGNLAYLYVVGHPLR